MLRPIFAALLLLTAAPALADDWRYVVIDVDGEVISFVDFDSIRSPDANTRTAWVLNVQRDIDELGVGARRYAVVLDCPGRRGRVVRIVTYDMANRQVDDLEGQGQWNDMDPGTAGGDLLDFVCSNGASRADAPSMGAELPLEAARRVMRRGVN